jgi:DNA-binding beta-propeller fold protein YncE
MKNLLAVVLFLCVNVVSFAQQPTFKFVTKWSIPSGNEKWDYLKLEDHKLYVSHADRVHILDAKTGLVLSEISNLKGVHGIIPALPFGKGYISNGLSNEITIFDLKTLKVLKTITIPGKKADAVYFDPFSNRVFVFNNGSGNAVAIDPKTDEVVGQVDMGGAPEFGVGDLKGSIFNNNEDSHEIFEFDAKTLKIKNRFSLAPNEVPTGLDLDVKNNRLFSVCRKTQTLVVMDSKSGKIISTLPIGAGVDGVVFDPKLGLIIASNGDGTATVVKQNTKDSYSVIQTLETSKGLKTVTIDKKSHQLFFSGATFLEDGKTLAKSSFGIYVYQLAK